MQCTEQYLNQVIIGWLFRCSHQCHFCIKYIRTHTHTHGQTDTSTNYQPPTTQPNPTNQLGFCSFLVVFSPFLLHWQFSAKYLPIKNNMRERERENPKKAWKNFDFHRKRIVLMVSSISQYKWGKKKKRIGHQLHWIKTKVVVNEEEEEENDFPTRTKKPKNSLVESDLMFHLGIKPPHTHTRDNSNKKRWTTI